MTVYDNWEATYRRVIRDFFGGNADCRWENEFYLIRNTLSIAPDLFYELFRVTQEITNLKNAPTRSRSVQNGFHAVFLPFLTFGVMRTEERPHVELSRCFEISFRARFIRFPEMNTSPSPSFRIFDTNFATQGLRSSVVRRTKT